MPRPDWDERYQGDDLPWDTGEVDPHLLDLFSDATLRPCRTLELGCGTGTNAIFLADRGFEVHAVDISPRAIELARSKAAQSGSKIRFEVHDILAAPIDAPPFDFVFDRGVFHVFDEADERCLFAQRVADCLAPNGLWLSLMGSTEGPARDHGPPRRSARDIVEAVEPVLELVRLRGTSFHADIPSPARAWLMLARARAMPAQPSTRRD